MRSSGRRVQRDSERPGPSPLGILERAFLEALWERSVPMSARDVQAAYVDRQLAYATVRTVLNRLAEKGLVRRVHGHRAWLYEPAASREAFVAELMLQALNLTAHRESALAHFVRAVKPADADALRHALEPDGQKR